MSDLVLSRRLLLKSSLICAVPLLLRFAHADEPPTTRVLRQEKDRYTVTLRLPTTSIVANVEAVLYLRVERTGEKGQVETVPFARVDATAKAEGETKGTSLNAYPDGVAGEYSLVGKLTTAGKYTVDVTVTPASTEGSQPISVSFSPILVLSAVEKEKEQSANYSVKIEPTPSQPLPGELVNLHISIIDNLSKKRITEFESIYNSPMLFYVVREDTSDLRREKPVAIPAARGSKDDGVFELNYAFPAGGAWRIFVEVAPQGQGLQMLSTRLTIPGARALPEPMMAQIAPLVQQNGVTLRFARPTRLLARETLSIPLELQDSQGNAISDLQIVDTALAHLYFAERDGKTFLHTVPDSRDPRNGRSGSNTLTFPVRFPKAGTYRAWLALSRSGQTAMITFVVRVYDK